jgi:hypothetical protein
MSLKKLISLQMLMRKKWYAPKETQAATILPACLKRPRPNSGILTNGEHPLSISG